MYCCATSKGFVLDERCSSPDTGHTYVSGDMAAAGIHGNEKE